MSVRYLIDTHVLLWSWHLDHRQRAAHRDILMSDADVFVSMATVWEIAIKSRNGKLSTIDDVPAGIAASGFKLLPIETAHTEIVRQLPLLKDHRDPFDRMLVAQAMVEGLTVMTVDAAFAEYDIEIV